MLLGSTDIFVWVFNNLNEVEAYYQQGWELSYIRRGHWGKSFLLKHEEV